MPPVAWRPCGARCPRSSVALLVRGRERVAVAVLTGGSPSHAHATETLRGVFGRLPAGMRRR